VKKGVQEACPEIIEIREAKGLDGGAESGARFVSPFALGAKGSWLFAASLSDIPEGAVRAMELGD
jgi:hypothetical protein